MARLIGSIKNEKDIVNKKYVDEKDQLLDEVKLEESDLEEFSNSELQALWNAYMKN